MTAAAPNECSNCLFGGKVVSGRGDVHPYADSPDTVFVCRRQPPTLRILSDGKREVISSIFTPVHQRNWCGEWTTNGRSRV